MHRLRSLRERKWEPVVNFYLVIYFAGPAVPENISMVGRPIFLIFLFGRMTIPLVVFYKLPFVPVYFIQVSNTNLIIRS